MHENKMNEKRIYQFLNDFRHYHKNSIRKIHFLFKIFEHNIQTLNLIFIDMKIITLIVKLKIIS